MYDAGLWHRGNMCPFGRAFTATSSVRGMLVRGDGRCFRARSTCVIDKSYISLGTRSVRGCDAATGLVNRLGISFNEPLRGCLGFVRAAATYVSLFGLYECSMG